MPLSGAHDSLVLHQGTHSCSEIDNRQSITLDSAHLRIYICFDENKKKEVLWQVEKWRLFILGKYVLRIGKC
jgi:hypothetical protein